MMLLPTLWMERIFMLLLLLHLKGTSFTACRLRQSTS